MHLSKLVGREGIITLFNNPMKLLGEVIQRLGLSCHKYADENELLLVVPADPKEVVEPTNWLWKAVMGWIKANKLKRNPEKNGGATGRQKD